MNDTDVKPVLPAEGLTLIQAVGAGTGKPLEPNRSCSEAPTQNQACIR